MSRFQLLASPVTSQTASPVISPQAQLGNLGSSSSGIGGAAMGSAEGSAEELNNDAFALTGLDDDEEDCGQTTASSRKSNNTRNTATGGQAVNKSPLHTVPSGAELVANSRDLGRVPNIIFNSGATTGHNLLSASNPITRHTSSPVGSSSFGSTTSPPLLQQQRGNKFLVNQPLGMSARQVSAGIPSTSIAESNNRATEQTSRNFLSLSGPPPLLNFQLSGGSSASSRVLGPASEKSTARNTNLKMPQRSGTFSSGVQTPSGVRSPPALVSPAISSTTVISGPGGAERAASGQFSPVRRSKTTGVSVSEHEIMTTAPERNGNNNSIARGISNSSLGASGGVSRLQCGSVTLERDPSLLLFSPVKKPELHVDLSRVFVDSASLCVSPTQSHGMMPSPKWETVGKAKSAAKKKQKMRTTSEQSTTTATKIPDEFSEDEDPENAWHMRKSGFSGRSKHGFSVKNQKRISYVAEKRLNQSLMSKGLTVG